LPAPDVYDLDVATCFAEFAVRHLGLATARGRLRAAAGQLTVADDALDSWVRVDFDTSSVTTGSDELDAFLRGPGGLFCEEFPLVRFESTGFAETRPNRFLVDGDLYVRDGVTRVELDARLVSAAGDDSMRWLATGTVNRHDLGVVWPPSVERLGIVIADRVRLTLGAEFRP